MHQDKHTNNKIKKYHVPHTDKDFLFIYFQIERETDRQTETERQRETQRENETETERHTQRKKQR